MKTRVTVILLLVAAVGLGLLYTRQTRKLSVNQSQVASLRREVERTSDQVHELELAKAHINRQRQEAEHQAMALLSSRQTSAPPAAASPSPVPGSSAPAAGVSPQTSPQEGFGKMLAKMMEDPDTRKFIRDQQRVVMDQLYAPMIKQMALSPEEAEKFKDLLADNTMKNSQSASSLFGGAAGTNRTEALAAIAASQRTSEEQMRELLGDGRYQQYQEYQKTAGERIQLNAFKQQLSGEAALNDQQTEQLLALMSEEKKELNFIGQSVPGADQPADQVNAMLSQEKSEQLLLSQENLSQRVQERARTLLNPTQLEAFAKFQTNQLQMMRMGMTMARKMFAPSETPAAPAP